MSGTELLVLLFTGITSLATLVVAFVAGWNARNAAREYRWARRPFLQVHWEVRGAWLRCVVREIAQRPTALHHIQISVSTLPARSLSKTDSAPFQQLHKANDLNLPLLADKAPHTVPLHVPVLRGGIQPTLCVELTASAGGPPLTQHFYTDFRQRTSDSEWEIDNLGPYDMPSPTFLTAVADSFWGWWCSLHTKER